MKFFIYFITLPLIQISRVCVALNLSNIANDLQSCISVVNEQHDEVPMAFVPYLIAAEDHRFLLHCGVDPISIIRVLITFMKKRKIHGASTIEQQFVRVVTNRYERTLSRKIREQMIAIALTRIVDKEAIARSYLAIANYGTLYQGKKGIEKLMNNRISVIDSVNIIGIVARLKYPEPLQYSEQWNSKFMDRIDYVKSRLEIHNELHIYSPLNSLL